MPLFAAIDVGSNAMRLQIAQATDPHRVSTFRSERVPVRLGHSVFQTGSLDPAVIDQAVETMRFFADAMDEADVQNYRAVVTASARGAKNGRVLIDRIRDEAGLTLSPIDGAEEARLVTMAVRSKMVLGEYALLMDLGGGSLEVTHIENEQTDFCFSLPIGTVRLLEAFLDGDGVVTPKQEKLVREYLDRVLEPHRKDLRLRKWDAVVGTGGNLEAIAKLCPAKESIAGQPTIDIAKAKTMLTTMSGMSAKKRERRYTIKPDRADVIVPALQVVTRIASLSKVNRIVAPGVGVKDGILTELIAKHYRVWDYSTERDKLLAAGLQLGRRYHFDERHAMRVSALALELFDATQTLHGLSEEDRSMLRLAALLHDVGDFLNPSGHHKHSEYIIESSEVMGLPFERRKVIAQVARYHRRSFPTTRHAKFKALDEDTRERVRRLAAILRIADALDRGHRSKVEQLSVDLSNKTLQITVGASEDASLELWTAERKGDLFTEVFGMPVKVSAAEA
ncbi:MAG: Ppx/GppA family phosphatase [Myxococcales bacterium]|nr:Ppx/GppA family phosphatase [Myxococcales bacterium]MCB9629077.1 Ppx/GppA family phosphatase [Sandaracinaceae bacterium]